MRRCRPEKASFDTRVPGPTAHWTDDAFSERAQWLSLPTSSLRLRDVQSRDRAIYRCRVDFQVSPTRNYRISLDVIELPSKPVIFDDYGKEISGIAGPYNEGGDFKLICSVNGGNPTPRVQWFQGDTVLATLGTGEPQPLGTPRTLILMIKNATRVHQSSVYTCAADNTLLTSPLKTSVRVDLYLRPLTVEILSREQPLSVGRMTELWCRSTGARPPATISWWLGGKQLKSTTKYRELADGNETQSLLQWTPLKEQNNLILTCRAEHLKFNKSTIESKLPLNIYYVPVATITLGSKMNPNDIEEGDDVYFECTVDANPPAYKVVWEHNRYHHHHHHHQPINVPTAGAQAFPMDGIGRLGHDLPSEARSHIFGRISGHPSNDRALRKYTRDLSAALRNALVLGNTVQVNTLQACEALECGLLTSYPDCTQIVRIVCVNG
ncbi:hypothetical protein evm_003041 [Chilo suppressalis]|nr:hypothetical protein evm_003041 [Chilo suppressalis]